MIREASHSDSIAIAGIYNYYILNTSVTFELEPVTHEEISRRMENYKLLGPYLVYEEDNEVVGYSYVSKFRDRQAYNNSCESTIYIKKGYGGKGIGYKLYSGLLSEVILRYHVVIGGISLPNAASVRLHEKIGFKKVGHFCEVGKKFGKWVDVGFWQLTAKK